MSNENESSEDSNNTTNNNPREPYSNPVDATYSNPKQSKPSEPTKLNTNQQQPNLKKPDSKTDDETLGYETAANPVDASYAPSSYASFSKVQPTAATEIKSKATLDKTESINSTDNDSAVRGPSHHTRVAPTVSRSVHQEPILTEHQHGLHSSMVAWSAIFAGTLISASISLVLLFFASAMGLASISPWSHEGASAQAFSMGAAILLILMQCFSSGLGGYLTGRLRSKWINMTPDEVFFRDTAHGFLSWAIATILTAALLSSAASSAINAGTATATALNQSATRSVVDSTQIDTLNPEFYYVDRLFRTNHLNSTERNMRIEANSILMNALANRNLSDLDRAYLAQLVSWHTGLTNNEAIIRVHDIVSQIEAADVAVRQNADIVRKAASSIALFTFLSLLMGAFVASVGAAMGGHHRDKI